MNGEEEPHNSPDAGHQNKCCSWLPCIPASDRANAQPNGTTNNGSDLQDEKEILKAILMEIRDFRNKKNDPKNKYEKIHGSLMVVAVLAAGVTYQAGLSPPGGFWQANDDQGHTAGIAVLRNTFPNRYKAFYYCNATAFIMSLVTIILLMQHKVGKKTIKVIQIVMILDLFGIMGAYAAGSCRDVPSSIVLFCLMGVIFCYIVLLVVLYVLIEPVVKKYCSKLICCGCRSNP